MYRLSALNKIKIYNFSNKFVCHRKHIPLSNEILNKFNEFLYTCKHIHINKLLDPNENHAFKKNENDKISKGLSENEYLVKIQHDPDKFGNTSNEKEVVDEGDCKEEEYLENPPMPRRLSTKQYADIIKEFISKRKIKEAIDVMEIKMLKDDKVKPENYIYNLLLGACGRVGYTKKAFSLYNQMKKRGLAVTGGTYTALFNACANSPWKDDGLTRAEHLRNIMIEKHYEPNDSNYNAMIKAFGRCGDLKTAFSLCDEMISKAIPVRDDTLNFLLQACVTDQEAGFRHALLVWRKFMDKNIPPSIYSYNLMLRCIRDCGLGDVNVTKDAVDKILLSSQKSNNTNLQIACSDNTISPIETGDMTPNANHNVNSVFDIVENRPNLMAKNPHLGNIISISEVKTPEDRLLLVGGYSKFLENMKENNVIPDIKTFTQLLDCIPNTDIAEKEMLNAINRHKVKIDIDFYNMLIKRRSMRFEYESAREVLREMQQLKFRPNLITYGVLALGCKTKEEAESLIEEMNAASYRLNTEIIGTMLNQACYHNNFQYIFFLLDICINNEIRPNQKFMGSLNDFRKKCRKYINDVNNALGKTKSFQKDFQTFRLKYKNFLNKADPITEDETHPWQQFRETTNTDVRHFKDKEARFKARHVSLFRQKKGEMNVKNTKAVVANKNKIY